jgi:Domain of unknown function (DUF4129)
MDSTPRARNAVLTALGVVVSLAVVAIAARESTSTGSGAARRPSDTLLDIFLTLYIVALVAGALFFIYLLVLRRKLLAQPEDMHRRDIRNALGTIIFVGLALLLARTLGERQAGTDITIPQAPAADPNAAAQPGKEVYEPEFAWIPVLVTVALVLLAVFGWWWSDRSRRRARGELDGSLLAEAMAEAVDVSLDDLRAETDPRRAVIAAYARLEQVLASHGLPRVPAEAPLEYLRRMLAELSVSPAAARRLTELFERAKFSQHAVEPEMKEQAIRALEVVRDDLRAARERAEAERAAALAALARRPVSR